MGQLKIDVEITHPPALVWRALTEAKLLNEWFQPVAGWPESGARPGSHGRVFPTDDLKGFGSFDMDVMEAEPHSRLVCRWRGDDFTSEITFEIRPVPGGGSRLLARQAGSLGTQEAERRETLGQAHQVMIERLRAVVDRLALGVGEGAFLKTEASQPAQPAQPRPESHQRARLVAVVCVVLVAGLCGTAGALWMSRDTPPLAAPVDGASSEPSLGSVGPQPVASGFPAPSRVMKIITIGSPQVK
ncbi:MAG TPA: SRPBCC domain-containing protein [Candidatus Limnocylindrales bacterium]|nr:SRPBCC domain-containing protein [Candidatus Limnocylindrales bacterium]